MSEFDDFFAKRQSPSQALAAPPMVAPAANEFDSFMERLKSTKDATLERAQTTAVTNSQQSTATAAGAAPVSRALNLPQAVVETDLPSYQQKATAQRNAELLKTNPVLASWVAANPDSARVAQDEYESLSGAEKLWDGIKRKPYSLLQGLGSSFNQASIALNRIGAAGSILAGSRAGNDYFQRQVIAGTESQKALELDERADFGDKAVHTVGNLLGMLSQVVLTGGAGGEALPASAGVAQTVKAAGATAAKSMAFPSLTASVNKGAEVYDKTGDPVLASKAAVAEYLFTTAQGAVPLSAPGGLVKRLGTGAVSGAVTGEAQRSVENLLMPPEMQRPFNPQEALFQAFTGALMGGVMGPRVEPNLYPAVRRTYVDALRAETATDAMGRVQQLGKIAAESQLRQADPQAFRQFVEQVTEHSELEAVYVDPRVLADSLKQSVVAEIEPELRARIAEATSTGADVRIPVADYAAHIAGTPLEEALLPKLKATPDGMTFEEGQQHFKEQQKQLQAVADKVAQAQEKTLAVAADAQKVHDDVLGQLETLKRFTPEVNRAYAALTRDFFSTLASRTGEKASALYDRYALKVQAESPAGALKQDTREMVDLRKRESILQSIMECLA